MSEGIEVSASHTGSSFQSQNRNPLNASQHCFFPFKFWQVQNISNLIQLLIFQSEYKRVAIGLYSYNILVGCLWFEQKAANLRHSDHPFFSPGPKAALFYASLVLTLMLFSVF